MHCLNVVHDLRQPISDCKMLLAYLEILQTNDDIDSSLYHLEKCEEYLDRVKKAEHQLNQLREILTQLIP